jgi:uncharacterized membrane protein
MRSISELALRRLAAGLALLGLGIAIYITIADAGGGAPACIAGGHGCQTVAESDYAELAGVEVSVLGIGGYVLLLGAALARGDAARVVGLGLALVGFGFSLYLTYLELFVIDAICQWCVASAVVMTALLVVGTLRAWLYTGTELGPGATAMRPE